MTVKNQQERAAEADRLNEIIINSIQDIKGSNIRRLDMRNLEDAPADFFILCEGESSTKVNAIADHIVAEVRKELEELPRHKEGAGNAKWVLVDYFSTVVHIFYPQTRAFYNLDGLWSDADVVEFDVL